MLNRHWLLRFLLVAALGIPAHADRASDAFKKGVEAEHQANTDAAFNHYKEAFTAAPNNPKYFAAYARVRFSASMQHMHNGQTLRNAGSLPEALAEYQRAAEIDASSAVAQQEVRRTAEMIQRQERQLAQKKAAAVATVKGLENVAELVELQPLSNAPLSLHMTANADVIYKTIGKLANLNVVIDSDYRPQKLTVDLSDVTIHEALDLVRLQSKTFWRPVLANTIFVAADSAAKRKELEQNVMRTFYLQNLAAPSELQEAANLLRQMLDVSRVQLLQAQGALIVRATPDQMILAEKLLTDIDKPKSEVVVDVAVMEVSRDKIRTIGANLPTAISAGLLPTAAGAASAAGATGFAIGNFALSVPGGSFSFLASDSHTKLIQNPEIRTLNDVKATLRIGDRVPIATGSFAGTVGGTGVSPLVSTQFQYLDVGVNIDITPHIHSNNEVTLKMVLEISSVTGSQSTGGITQPIIGQRRIEHETRLMDGEVNLLGGILEDSETQSMSGYPWITKIPLLKYLFAQDNKERTENEIVFAITPHIVRGQEVTEENLRSIDVGSGTAIELRRRKPAPADVPPGESQKVQPGVPNVLPSRVPASTTPAVPAALPVSSAQVKQESPK